VWTTNRLLSGKGDSQTASTISQAAIHGICAFNLLYVLVIASLFELGEGCFMRMPIDPLILFGGTWVVSKVGAALIGKGRINLSP
jgi:hypothetical protein